MRTWPREFVEVLVKKLLVALLIAGAVTFAVSSPAAAQSDAAIVKIPFQFVVGQRELPAGSYRIARQGPHWSVVCISGLDSKQLSAFVMTVAQGNSEPTYDPRVTFVTYSGHRFLRSVAVPGGDVREVTITKAKAERTLAKLNLLTAEPANVAK